jgi:hypothetical protein
MFAVPIGGLLRPTPPSYLPDFRIQKIRVGHPQFLPQPFSQFSQGGLFHQMDGRLGTSAIVRTLSRSPGYTSVANTSSAQSMSLFGFLMPTLTPPFHSFVVHPINALPFQCPARASMAFSGPVTGQLFTIHLLIRKVMFYICEVFRSQIEGPR